MVAKEVAAVGQRIADDEGKEGQTDHADEKP